MFEFFVYLVGAAYFLGLTFFALVVLVAKKLATEETAAIAEYFKYRIIIWPYYLAKDAVNYTRRRLV